MSTNQNSNTAPNSATRIQIRGTEFSGSLYGSSRDETLLGLGGDGQDQIVDDNEGFPAQDEEDRVAFGAGIDKEDLWLRRVGASNADLEITVLGNNGGKVTVKDHFAASGNTRVEKLALSDGSELGWSQLQTLIDAMVRFSVPNQGLSSLSQSQRTTVQNAINSAWTTASSV